MYIFYLLVSTILVILFFLEYFSLRYALNKIPIRILVNGTRGKSTTVQILYEILRASGQKVFAKTTGNAPQLFYPDGSVTERKRIAPASIIENRNILWAWAKQRPDALILECMALQPETQRTLSTSILKPTITVITNILSDHKEVMGQTLEEITRSLAECVHKDSELFIPDTSHTASLWQKRPSAYLHVLEITSCPFILPNVPRKVLDESWTLISAVTTRLKLNQEKVSLFFQRIWKEIDAKLVQEADGKLLRFYNLFSANDVQSAKVFIEHFLQKKKPSAKIVFYLNCRADRPLRSGEFAELLSQNYNDSEIWLTGSGWPLAYRLLRKKFPEMRIFNHPPENALRTLASHFDEEIYIFGIGNHKGIEPFLEGVERLLKEKHK